MLKQKITGELPKSLEQSTEFFNTVVHLPDKILQKVIGEVGIQTLALAFAEIEPRALMQSNSFRKKLGETLHINLCQGIRFIGPRLLGEVKRAEEAVSLAIEKHSEAFELQQAQLDGLNVSFQTRSFLNRLSSAQKSHFLERFGPENGIHVALKPMDSIGPIKTGIVELDKITGGFERGNLVVFAGRPAMGKTAVVMDLAFNAASENGNVVAYFSLELSKEEVCRRFLSRFSKVAVEEPQSLEGKKLPWLQLGQVMKNGI